MDNLEETITLMTSDNYKDRFVAEYRQLSIRCAKLGNAIRRAKAGEFSFNCPLKLIDLQYVTMIQYMAILQERASIEGISLE